MLAYFRAAAAVSNRRIIVAACAIDVMYPAAGIVTQTLVLLLVIAVSSFVGGISSPGDETMRLILCGVNACASFYAATSHARY